MIYSIKLKKIRTLGVSLVEVLIALFVISVGIMGVMAALTWGVQHSDSGKVMTEATTLARTFTETIRLRGIKSPFPAYYTNSVADRVALDAAPFDGPDSIYLKVIKGPTDANTQSSLARFQRNISIKKLDKKPADPPHVDSLARLSVKIYWQEEELERHVDLETIIPITEGT